MLKPRSKAAGLRAASNPIRFPQQYWQRFCGWECDRPRVSTCSLGGLLYFKTQPARKKLKACAFDQRQVVEAPTVLICCGDRRATGHENIEAVIELGKAAGAINDNLAGYMRQAIPQLFENRPCFESLETWTNRHTMLAVAHLMIAAKSFGIDSCPMEGFVSAMVKEAFQIPEEVDVCCLLPLGYAAEPLKQYGGRFEVTQVYYSESYGQALQVEI